jgi:hypothetical protein
MNNNNNDNDEKVGVIGSSTDWETYGFDQVAMMLLIGGQL